VKKDQALAALAEAHSAAVAAEVAAAAAQDRKREAVRAAFNAGARGPEVAEVLGSSVQWAYQLKDKQPLRVA
jgi:hypothetical protein